MISEEIYLLFSAKYKRFLFLLLSLKWLLFSLFFTSETESDIAVIEVGLRGTWDATNVICPLLSVITSIGYDHMDILDFFNLYCSRKSRHHQKRNPCCSRP